MSTKAHCYLEITPFKAVILQHMKENHARLPAVFPVNTLFISFDAQCSYPKAGTKAWARSSTIKLIQNEIWSMNIHNNPFFGNRSTNVNRCSKLAVKTVIDAWFQKNQSYQSNVEESRFLYKRKYKWQAWWCNTCMSTNNTC